MARTKCDDVAQALEHYSVANPHRDPVICDFCNRPVGGGARVWVIGTVVDDDVRPTHVLCQRDRHDSFDPEEEPSAPYGFTADAELTVDDRLRDVEVTAAGDALRSD